MSIICVFFVTSLKLYLAEKRHREKVSYNAERSEETRVRSPISEVGIIIRPIGSRAPLIFPRFWKQ